MRTRHGAVDRPIHKDGRPQLLLVGRLPHALCRRLALGRPESRLHMQGSCGLRVGLRPRCRANTPRCSRPSKPQGRTPAAPAGVVGRLPHALGRRLTLGRPESRLHMQGSCGLRVGLRPRCRANKPRCSRPSNPQGRTPAAPVAASARLKVVRRLGLGLPRALRFI